MRSGSGSVKSGAKQKKSDDSGDTSFTRRPTGVATLFEDDEVDTSALFGSANAKDDGLDFDSILNSEPSTPFTQGPGQQGTIQYGNGSSYPQQQQSGVGARPYTNSRAGHSSGYSSAANSMGSWNNSNSSWNYVEQPQQQSPYTSSSSGGGFQHQQQHQRQRQNNSPYPTSARGMGNAYNNYGAPQQVQQTQQQGWGARPVQQAYQGSQQQNRWQQPNTPTQSGVGPRSYDASKPGFGGLQRR